MLSKRSQFGILSLVTLGLAAILWLVPGEKSSYLLLQAALLRVGLVLGAVWLAFPQLSKLPLWLATIGVGSLLAVLLFKKAAIIVIPLLILIYFLRPRPKKKPSASSRESSTSSR